jgi:hypothetical protein
LLDCAIAKLYSSPVFIFVFSRGTGGLAGGIFMLFAIMGLVLFLIGGVFMLGREAYTRISAERYYQTHYGSDWKERYLEEQHVSVAKTNQDIMVGVGGLLVIPTTAFLIYRQFVPNRGNRSGSRRRHRRRSCSSNLSNPR